MRESKKDITNLRNYKYGVIENLRKEIGQLKDRFEGGSTSTNEYLFNKFNERQIRSSNVMIFNLPESENDLDEVTKLKGLSLSACYL